MKKERLFTPGPVEIPDRIRKVLGSQIIHHRTKEFKEAFLETRDLFKKLLKNPSDNFVFFASSGTGAMESAALNFTKENDKVLVVNGGKFGERWVNILKLYNRNVIEIKIDWGLSITKEEIIRVLEKEKDIKAIFLQLSETSTGAFHDTKELKEILKDKDILVVCDVITALGVYDIEPESFGIDVLVGGSQKALMLPPGLSMVWFSEKAKAFLNDKESFYFNIKKELPKQLEGQTAWTPAIDLILGLKESLSMILEEGIENVEKRAKRLSKAIRASIESINFSIFPKNPSISLSVIDLKGLDAEKIRKKMIDMGIRVAGGQDHIKGRVIRVSHMGHVDEFDIVQVILALEIALKDINYDFEEGSLLLNFKRALN